MSNPLYEHFRDVAENGTGLAMVNIHFSSIDDSMYLKLAAQTTLYMPTKYARELNRLSTEKDDEFWSFLTKAMTTFSNSNAMCSGMFVINHASHGKMTACINSIGYDKTSDRIAFFGQSINPELIGSMNAFIRRESLDAFNVIVSTVDIAMKFKLN